MNAKELKKVYLEIEELLAEDEDNKISLVAIKHLQDYIEENKNSLTRPDVSTCFNYPCLMWMDTKRNVVLKVFYEDGAVINADSSFE